MKNLAIRPGGCTGRGHASTGRGHASPGRGHTSTGRGHASAVWISLVLELVVVVTCNTCNILLMFSLLGIFLPVELQLIVLSLIQLRLSNEVGTSY